MMDSSGGGAGGGGGQQPTHPHPQHQQPQQQAAVTSVLPAHLVSVLSAWPALSALPLDNPALLVRSGLLVRLAEMSREITAHLQMMQAQRIAASRLLSPEAAAREAAGQLTPQQLADAHLYQQLHALLTQVQIKEREVEHTLQQRTPTAPAAFEEGEPGAQRQQSNVDMQQDGGPKNNQQQQQPQPQHQMPSQSAAQMTPQQQQQAAWAQHQQQMQKQAQMQQQQQQQHQQYPASAHHIQQQQSAAAALPASSSATSSASVQPASAAAAASSMAMVPSTPNPASGSAASSTSSAGFTWILPPDRRKLPGDRYQKIRTIRKTLFGKVVLYFDTQTQTRVAIKLSNKELLGEGKTTTGNSVAENPLEELRFLRILSRRNEADSSGAASNAPIHPGQNHVLQLLDECEDATDLWTVLEFCGKGEFFDIVCAANRFDEAKARMYFIQLAQGVAYMHAHLICHLDLSLENMLMDENDVCKPSYLESLYPALQPGPAVLIEGDNICDFGVARLMTLDHNRHLVAYPGIKKNKPGKIGYMSPELFAGNSFYGHLSDVWAMGIILFISLTGVPPYQLPAMSDQRFALIYNGNLAKLLAAWQMTNIMSAGAKDILSRMLCPPERRMNIQQILAHPWVTGAAQ